MKKIVISIMFFVLLSSFMFCIDNKDLTKNDPLTIEDFYINRIKDGFVFKTNLHITELSKDIPEADDMVIVGGEDYPEYLIHYYTYDGLSIEAGDSPEPFCDDNDFSITNNSYKTLRNIKIGDTRDDVWEKYGNPGESDSIYIPPEGDIYYYSEEDGSSFLSINFFYDQNSIVKEIIIIFHQICL